MLITFEGTGWGGREDLSNYTGKPIPYDGALAFNKSFAHLAFSNKVGFGDYIPGPGASGSNCDNILEETIAFFDIKASSPNFKRTKISLFGYSRGAYLAMCFAKYLQSKEYEVEYMGLFDPVSQDLTFHKYKTTLKIPTNVKYCYVSYRSSKIGSRKSTMNSVDQKQGQGKIANEFEDGTSLQIKKYPYGDINRPGGYVLELPGSHAAMGGFPNAAGVLDRPNWGQGKAGGGGFDPKKEVTAWWLSGHFVSHVAVQNKLLSNLLVPRTKPKGFLEDSNRWYKKWWE